MIIKNLRLVLHDKVLENAYLKTEAGLIKEIGTNYKDNDAVDGNSLICMPGFIDIHTHGSCNIDFMDAKASDYKTIENAFYKEGITTFLATTLTSDYDSLKRVCETVTEAKKEVKSLLGIHFEGPYISLKYKGAQNPEFIRLPDINEFKDLLEASNGNVRLITLAPENVGAMDFIEFARKNNVVVSAGHSDASFNDIKEAIGHGLTNITHTHNAMSKYENRNPGIVTASMYFDSLYTECITDLIHVDSNTLKTFYKIIGPDRFMIITDSLSCKHADTKELKLFGLDCEARDGAVYLKSGPLAGSILMYNQALRNMKSTCDTSLVELARISSYNQAKSLSLSDVGKIAINKKADFVLLDDNFEVMSTYKEGKQVYKK